MPNAYQLTHAAPVNYVAMLSFGTTYMYMTGYMCTHKASLP